MTGITHKAQEQQEWCTPTRLRADVVTGAGTGAALIAVSLIAAFAALAAGPSASAQCQYSVEEIVPPPCPFSGPPPLIGRGLNNHGEVVGYFFDCEIGGLDHAFYWSEKTGFIELPKPDGATTMRANDINDHGQIVGDVLFPSVAWKGFMYDMNTEAFDFLESKFGVGTASANAINNNGVVAGSRSISKSGGTPFNAVIWDTNTGEVTDLGVMQGPNSWASDINDAGQISGSTGVQFTTNSQGWVLLDDKLILLGPIPCGSSSGAIGISSDGTVASGGHLLPRCGPAASQGALWHDGKWELLPLPPNTTGGSALAINDLHQATGRVLLTAGGERGALWQHGTIHLLPDLLAPGQSLFPIEQSRAVNNAGQILVRVTTRAAILTPINVPFADLNFDCTVDVYDLLILLNHWGPVSKGAPTGGSSGIPLADFNGDGVVDVIDLFILLANWG